MSGLEGDCVAVTKSVTRWTLAFVVLFVIAACRTFVQSAIATDLAVRHGDLSARCVSSSEIDLSWKVSVGGVSSYAIFRDGILLATISGARNFYRDRELAPSTTYTYSVVASSEDPASAFLRAISGTAKTTDVAGRTPGIVQPLSGTVILHSGDNIQAAVDHHLPGTKFYLHSGVYRLSAPVKPKSLDSFEGAPGAVLNGSVVLRFRRLGRYYVARGVPQQKQGNTSGACDRLHPMCRYVQDLYFDATPLMPVSELSTLGPRRWYFNRNDSIVYLSDDPTGHLIELGFGYAAFDNPSASNVRIANLTVEKFATQGQLGAIGFRVAGDGWIVEDNEVRLNHAAGININNHGVVRGNYVHDNGEKGITGGNATSLAVVNNETSFNNYAGYTCDWECGGMKFGNITNSVIEGNYAHDNIGTPGNGAPGLWCDVDCDKVTFRNNTVVNNGGGGIAYEISHHGTFAYNVIRGNGGQSAAWGWGSGLQINESDHVSAFGNVLAGNHNGIIGVQQRRGSGPRGAYLLENMDVHDNVTRVAASDPGAPGTAAGIFEDDGDYEVFSGRHNVYQRNSYTGLAANLRAFQWIRGRTTAEQWRVYGNDTNGSFSR